MKHYIYIDKEILNSYISQIYGGIVNKEKIETANEKIQEQNLNDVEAKIKNTVQNGIPHELTDGIEEIKAETISNISKEVVEKIYHDNLLDNLIKYITDNETVKNDLEKLEYGNFVICDIPFNFVNHDYLNSISCKTFKDSYEKIINSTSKDDKLLKDAKKGMEIIANFTKFFESCFPVKQLIITDNLIIPLNSTFLREDANMIDFKYGGKIKLIGKVTKNCSVEENIFGLYNEQFGKSIQEVKDAMYKIFLPKYKESFIITPIALYFE